MKQARPVPLAAGLPTTPWSGTYVTVGTLPGPAGTGPREEPPTAGGLLSRAPTGVKPRREEPLLGVNGASASDGGRDFVDLVPQGFIKAKDVPCTTADEAINVTCESSRCCGA